MEPRLISFEYKTYTKINSRASAVIYSNNNKYAIIIEEDKDNKGPSLTNSIEHAFLELKNLLKSDLTDSLIIHVDTETKQYALVSHLPENPIWHPIHHLNLLNTVIKFLDFYEEKSP